MLIRRSARATSASGRPPSRSAADVIDGPAGPVFIDINPRLVEPVNALESGVELTPGGGDRLAGVPVALTALATLIRPAAWRYFAGGSTGAYSLTPAAWEELRRAAAVVVPGLPGD